MTETRGVGGATPNKLQRTATLGADKDRECHSWSFGCRRICPALTLRAVFRQLISFCVILSNSEFAYGLPGRQKKCMPGDERCNRSGVIRRRTAADVGGSLREAVGNAEPGVQINEEEVSSRQREQARVTCGQKHPAERGLSRMFCVGPAHSDYNRERGESIQPKLDLWCWEASGTQAVCIGEQIPP
jgi:hypothetical protein